jgi:hypothetical protein
VNRLEKPLEERWKGAKGAKGATGAEHHGGEMNRKGALLMMVGVVSLLALSACERRDGGSDTTVRIRTGTDTVRDTVRDTIRDTVRDTVRP